MWSVPALLDLPISNLQPFLNFFLAYNVLYSSLLFNNILIGYFLNINDIFIELFNLKIFLLLAQLVNASNEQYDDEKANRYQSGD